MEEIFFTSDTHFGNDLPLKREYRPFENWKSFLVKTTKIWNKQTGKDAIIYHLGDYVDYVPNRESNWEYSLNWVKNFKAKIILIIGNNEERLIKDHFNNNFNAFRDYCINAGFKDVKKEDYLDIDGVKCYLNHFPRKFKEGYLNIFGHTHRTTGIWKPFGLNVGCDLNHFRLVDRQELNRLIYDKNKYWDNDIDTNCMGK